MSQAPIDERQLLALLAGELDPEEAARVRRALTESPEAAARFRPLEAAWGELEPPPAPPVPEDFSRQVMARVRELAGSGEGAADLSLARLALGRLAAALILLVGFALGMGLGRLEPPAPEAAPAGLEAEDFFGEPPSMAAGYWLALSDGEEGGAER